MIITCNACRKALSIDESKLPMHEVVFSCPVCSAQLTVDGRAAAPQPTVSADEKLALGQRALLIGSDDPRVREAVTALGFNAQHFEASEQAREFYLQEFPPLIVLRPAQMSAPPLAEMASITSLNPAERRKAFIILIADNLRTFDGNAAFLYNVDLVVNSRDLGAIQQIYGEAEKFHQRLYSSFRAAAAG